MRALFARYVDAIAADRGGLAFVKWFLASAALHILVMVPVLVPVFASPFIPNSLGKLLVVLFFLVCLLLARIGTCALPSARAAERKGLGPMMLWGIAGFVLGPLVVGLVAALAPKGGAESA